MKNEFWKHGTCLKYILVLVIIHITKIAFWDGNWKITLAPCVEHKWKQNRIQQKALRLPRKWFITYDSLVVSTAQDIKTRWSNVKVTEKTRRKIMESTLDSWIYPFTIHLHSFLKYINRYTNTVIFIYYKRFSLL